MAAAFIAFEGIEGSGKSTQAALLAVALDALLTREPGGTTLGASWRAALLDPSIEGVDVRAEALLMAADRAQHVSSVIRPALDAGRHVVTDRYAASSLAYQGYGRGLPLHEVRRLSEWATGGLWPHLTVLVDVPLEVSAARLVGRLDRIESEGRAFHERVREGFLALAEAEAQSWVVLDGTASPEAVAAEVLRAVQARLGLTP